MVKKLELASEDISHLKRDQMNFGQEKEKLQSDADFLKVDAKLSAEEKQKLSLQISEVESAGTAGQAGT